VILGISHWLVVDVFEIEQASQAKTILALQLSAATIFAMLIGQTATSVLQGLHRFDIFSRIQNGTSIIALLGNLLLVYNGFGLLALLLWNLIVTIVSTIVAFLCAQRLLPELGFSLAGGREMTMLVLRYSGSVVGYQILTNAFFIFERGWVVSRYGSESLTFYIIPMTLGIYLHGFIFSLSMFLFPLASELDRDRDRLVILYRGATKGVLSIVAILATTLIILGRPFLTLWLGNEFGERSGEILVIHTLAFGLAALVIVSHQTAEATGQPLFNFRNMAIGVAIAVPLVVFATRPYGLVGIALGRLAIFITTFAATAILERKTFGNVQSKFWRDLLIRIGVAVVATALVEKAFSSILPVSWVSLAITGSAGIAIYGLILFFLGTVSDEDRRLLRRMVNREA
jgi:O-antigen/teichoic acid export membrane protein